MVRKTVLLVLAALLALCVLVGCGAGEPAAASEEEAGVVSSQTIGNGDVSPYPEGYVTAQDREGQKVELEEYDIKVFDDTRDAAIICYKADTQEVEVPAELDGYPVTIIAEGAFSSYYSPELSVITLPDSLTTIESNAFSGVEKLTSAVIPDSVSILGANVYLNCTKLTAANIPEGITTVPWNFCSGCEALTGVSLPSTITVIGEYAFAGCDSLEEIEIPEGVTEIMGGAFFENSLKEVVLPSTLTTLCDNAFLTSAKLTKIVVPDSVVNIGAYAIADGGDESVVLEIWCGDGSAAMAYAKDHNIKYRLQ